MFKLPNKKLTAILGFLILGIHFGNAQEKFIGVLQEFLIEVDAVTAEIEVLTEIDFPTSDTGSDIAYSSSTCKFYTFIDRLDSPKLVEFDFDGTASLIGEFTIPGGTVSTVEAIAYNHDNDELYMGVSLNGVDFFAESLVKVNMVTAACEFKTEIIPDIMDPDIDNMCFDGNRLYYTDGRPNVALSDFYSIDFENLNDTTVPEYLFSVMYEGGADLAVLNDGLYYPTLALYLARAEITGSEVDNLAMTHGVNEFGGERLAGIEYIPGYIDVDVSLGADQFICPGEIAQLTFENPDNLEFEWSNGATTESIQVTEPGSYSVNFFLEGCPFKQSTSVEVAFMLDCFEDCATNVNGVGFQIEKHKNGYFSIRNNEGHQSKELEYKEMMILVEKQIQSYEKRFSRMSADHADINRLKQMIESMPAGSSIKW